MKKLIGVLVLIAILVLGSYCMMGWFTERTLKSNIATLNRGNENMVELQSYHRGWFSSVAQLKWVVKIPEPTSLQIPHSLLMSDKTYVTEVPLIIHHGPFIWVGHQMKLGLGYAQSKILIPTIYNQEYNSVFDDLHSTKPMIKLSAFVSYFNNTKIHIEAPMFDLMTKNSDKSFKWLGMSTDLILSGNKKYIEGNIALQGFTWTHGDVRGSVGPIQSAYALKRNLDNIYLGNAHLQLASATLIKANRQLMQLIDADIVSQNSIQDDLFKSEVSLKFNRLELKNLSLGPSHADINIKNLDAQTLESMNKVLSNTHAKTEEEKHKALLALIPELPVLLSKGAQINITDLEMTLAKGLLKANINLSFPNEAIYTPWQLMKKISGDGSIRLTADVFKTWLEGVVKQKLVAMQHQEPALGDVLLPQSNSPLDNVISSKLDEKINYLRNIGILKQDGNDYVLTFKLAQGQLMINDHVVSPEMFAI